MNTLGMIGFIEAIVIMCAVVFVLACLGTLMWQKQDQQRKLAGQSSQVMAPGPVGFVVLYRWRLVPGREDEFQLAWERLTKAIRAERGGLGSRLHRGVDGLWWAYAQWPTEERWRAAMAKPSIDDEAASMMGETILERFDPIPLTLIADLAVTPSSTEEPGA